MSTIYFKDIYVGRGQIKPLYVSIYLFVEEEEGEETGFDSTDAFQQ